MLDLRSAGNANQEHFRKDLKKSGSERYSGSFSLAGYRPVYKNTQNIINSSLYIPRFAVSRFHVIKFLILKQEWQETVRYTLKVAGLAQTYLIGIMPAQSRLFTIYILLNVSGTSGWKINRRRLFVSFQRKTFSSNGTSEKVVLFLRTECSRRKIVFHFFRAMFDTIFRLYWPFFGKWN